MRRLLVILGLMLLCISLANAQTPKIGIGAFGGMNMPILQEDQGNGTVFGIKAKLKIIPIILLEPNLTFGKWGEPDPIEGVVLGSGSKISSYGIDAILGGSPGMAGFKPYFLVGAGIYTVKNDDTGYDKSKLGYSAGLGISIGVGPKMDIDISGKAIFAPQDGGAKKAIFITGGLTYYLAGF
ncbi:MAG TPA: hypothetical protein ENL22_04955 [candidate division Zixibacteria bacterium]|nr:hypothetical protein [candidate division Zixibacteria bacterium]